MMRIRKSLVWIRLKGSDPATDARLIFQEFGLLKFIVLFYSQFFVSYLQFLGNIEKCKFIKK